MTSPNIKVEVGFDLTSSPSAPFFRLDDEVQGRLDNPDYRLAGTLFYDVTEYVSAVNITRGKQPIETYYQPGEAEVEFNNHNRFFDPLYTASPFVTNIVPRREVRVFGNEIEIYRGWIDDWDLNYQKDGDSISIAKAFDALQLLNNRVVLPYTIPVELSGSRIDNVLSRPEINWPTTLREIDAGRVNVADNQLNEPIIALEYLQKIAASDPGQVYITRDGKFKFDDRVRAPSSANLVSFGGTAIPFDNVTITFGAEELFNEIVLTRQGGGTVTASEPASIDEFGVRSWEIQESQVASDADLEDIAIGLIARYSRPTYRFSSLDVYLHKLSPENQDKVLSLDFGSPCFLTFTPNGIGDPIERYLEVIEIEHRIEVDRHTVTLGFNEIAAAALVLDDTAFGRLDVGVLSW